MARFTLTSLTIALLAFVAVRATSNSEQTIKSIYPVQTAQAVERDDSGNTALMNAAATGDAESVRQLIEQGAAVNAQGYIGNTALIFAAQEGHTDVAMALIEAGANPDAVNDYGTTARKLAAGYGHRDMVTVFDNVQSNGNLIAGLF